MTNRNEKLKRELHEPTSVEKYYLAGVTYEAPGPVSPILFPGTFMFKCHKCQLTDIVLKDSERAKDWHCPLCPKDHGFTEKDKE